MDKPYGGENTIKAIIKNIKNLFASKTHNHDDTYYKKEEIDSMELITTDDIDVICGSSIQAASEVMF